MAEIKTAPQQELSAEDKAVQEYNALCESAQVKEFVSLLTQETWVNICPLPELNKLMGNGFAVQAEYGNETDYRVNAVADGLLMLTKYNCNATVNDFERLVAKTQKQHKEFNREQAIEFLRKTRTGKELEQLAVMAESLKQELS